jgi:hypothetical protein
VSQPWFRKHARSGNTSIVAQRRPGSRLYANTVATALPHPRRADAGRWKKASAIAMALPHHGGLTPAALVHVRFCIAKIVILSADGRCNTAKSGGRKPPVEKALLC